MKVTPGSTHSTGSGQGESEQPSPGKSKTSKEMCRLHQASVVVRQANLTGIRIITTMILIKFYLCINVVNIADDDVDNPLGD